MILLKKEFFWYGQLLPQLSLGDLGSTNFYQEKEISDDVLNCEFEGVLGTTASIVGTIQANEALKMIMEIGQNLKNQILIIDLLNLNFRKVKFKKR